MLTITLVPDGCPLLPVYLDEERASSISNHPQGHSIFLKRGEQQANSLKRLSIQASHVLLDIVHEEGYDVIELASSDLDDPEAMKRHLKRINMKLRRR